MDNISDVTRKFYHVFFLNDKSYKVIEFDSDNTLYVDQSLTCVPFGELYRIGKDELGVNITTETPGKALDLGISILEDYYSDEKEISGSKKQWAVVSLRFKSTDERLLEDDNFSFDIKVEAVFNKIDDAINFVNSNKSDDISLIKYQICSLSVK